MICHSTVRHILHLQVASILFVAGGAMAQVATPSEAKTLNELRVEAETARASGNHAQAASAYSQLAERVPENAEYWHRAFRAYRSMDSTALALKHLEKALSLGYFYDARWTYEAALMNARLGHTDDAILWAERALDAGYSGRARLRSESAFNEIRADERFRKLAGIPPDSLSRIDNWRFDLEYFVAEAQRLHVSPRGEAHSDTFLDAAQSMHDRLPSMTDEQIVLAFMRLAALLKDGHSVVYGPQSDSPIDIDLSELPVRFYLFSDGLFIVEADDNWRHLIGSRVTRIGQLSPDDALARLADFRGVDNAMTMRWLGVQFYLRRYLMLRAIGASGAQPQLSLSVVDRDGEARTVSIGSADWEARRKLRSQARPDTALWLRHVDESYWLKVMPDLSTVYFQFNQVRDKGNGEQPLAQFAVTLADSLKGSSSRNLVIDLRHNNGGNNSLVRPLLQQIIGWEVSHPENRLWVITGRNTFSAAQNFLNQLERYTDATIVGEPSSSSPNFVGEETDIVLPWSKLSASISSRYWQDSDPTDRRPWVIPDVPVDLSSDAYFTNRDPVLEVVFSLIRGD